MRRKTKIFAIAVAIALFGFVVYSFLFGKLFPYSPLVIGFDRHELAHTVVFVQHGAQFSDFEQIDSLLPAVEEFHQLKFLRKPGIYIFRDRENYLRRSVSKARFCAFYNGNIIISPWAQAEAGRGEISLAIYLTHELSHSLLHQNAGLWHAINYPKWLLEGIAMYSANQMGTTWYPSKERTYEYIHQGNFMPPHYYGTEQEDLTELNVEFRIGFLYSLFGCFVDSLIENYGRPKFMRYMKQLLTESDHDEVFQEIFGVSYNEYVASFHQSILH